MKTSNKLFCCLSFALLLGTSAEAQFFKKLAKKAEKAAERTVERRVEQETSKKTDQALDSILEPGSGGNTPGNTPGNENTNGNADGNPSTTGPMTTGPKTMEVYSKFDFVPGDKPLFYDDFNDDFMGDFPSKWNTNGSGEVVTVGDLPGKWYSVANRSLTIPNLGTQLPEDFTIEFDLKVVNLSRNTGSGAVLGIYLSETDGLTTNENNAFANLNFCQYIAIGVRVDNNFRGDPAPIQNTLQQDLRQLYQDVVHVSIAVNKNRYRLWLNENKIADLPQFIVKPELINYLKFYVNGIDKQKRQEQVLISNLKIAEGGVDLRRKLMSEGKISTNGILFNSGSADILPQSMGIIRQISQVLNQDGSIQLNIVGHTDSDGSDESNMTLSKNRAEAVKKALVSVYGISPDRLTSEGKGETEPVADNTSAQGKAQNRRVEFIKK
ncbi:MAG: OmpA family protein [Muricauda sp.]|nr:OmpA family protein [Allomuricauda sp.]MBO6532973.1 OmpA family protein [Allomuricauda sp.]MBO6587478.1 OmpA family protein [Allomuricauda sp.]MBO6617103.1 OmpA family protein [Allomuricauda sp.]MBO6643886.1 OmpA family protein [Allomuricauda sp.]MBO6745438.1 OmpA family protein [Allomuricauda sp.]